MSDTNLDPSITALTNRASTVAVTATARELMNLSRLAPSLEQSENTDLEVAINARAEDLAPSATAIELKSIGKAIGNVLEAETFVAGGTLPNQAQNSGNFLATNGTAESWGGLSVSTLSEVNISSIMNDETLVYNHVSGLFENDSQVFRIQEIGLTENIPASGSFEGQVVFDQQTSELKYWDGSEWKVAAVVAAAGGSAVTYKIVVGARYDDDNGDQSGSVYVYDLDGTNEVKITASDGATDNYFGIATAVGNDKIVIGAHAVDDNGGDSGAVYVYDLDGSNEVKITSSDSAAGDNFGYSVAVGDNKIVVGARYDDDNGNNSGSVYVYDLDGTNEVKITASDGLELDKFGESVAVGDNKIVVAAMYDDQFDSNSAGGQVQFGSVYVYDLDGTNEVRITASDGAQFDYFGSSVAVGDNKIVVGAFETDVNGQNSGSVYVYDLDGTNEVKINASDGSENALFGSSVVVSDSKIYVGAKSAHNTFGAVYVYNLDGSGEVKITASDGAAYDYFGHSIAVGGNKIIVGAYLQDDNGTQSGSVYVYDLDGSNEVQFAASDVAGGDNFGYSVAVGSFTTSSGGSGEVVWSNAENNIVDVSGSNSAPFSGNAYASLYGYNLVAHTGLDGKDYYVAFGEGSHDGNGSHEIYNMTDGVSLGWSDGGGGAPAYVTTPKRGTGMMDASSYNGGDYYCFLDNNGAFVKRLVPGEFTSAHQTQGGGNYLSLASGFTDWMWHIRMHGQHLLVTRPGHGTVACIDWASNTLKWFGNKQSGGLNVSHNYPYNTNDFPAYNSDIGETYAAIQDMYDHRGASQSGAIYIVDIQSGNEVARLEDPNPRVNGRFGGDGGTLGDAIRNNAIAISGDKVVVGSPIDGAGKVHIFDMASGTLEFTIDSSTHASIATQVDGDTRFGDDIIAHGDYALVSKMSYVYVIQISTGQVVFETSSLGARTFGFTGNTLVGGWIGSFTTRYMKP